ncbi:MAG: PD-(D/E)XK nuclease domain-containing protein, partial [Bacteroidota bacterium]
SIFSELNNITDITFHKRYLGLTGVSQQELDENFAEEIEELANENGWTVEELKAKIRQWYNGYSWDGKKFVYNPYSLLSLFDFGEFKNFWFETGTPTFLLKLMENQRMVRFENIEVGEGNFTRYSIQKLQLVPLLFQTGYLTIKQKNSNGLYTLSYPNLEVRDSLLQHIIGYLRNTDAAFSTPTVIHLRTALEEKQFEQIIRLIKSIFKNIPSQIFQSKDKVGEFYYHSLIYLVFFYLGEYIESEVNTNDGRLDAVVKTSQYIYILEFKLDESGQAALDQIENKGYAEKYYADDREKILMGINFSSELKTVDDWKHEILR